MMKRWVMRWMSKVMSISPPVCHITTWQRPEDLELEGDRCQRIRLQETPRMHQGGTIQAWVHQEVEEVTDKVLVGVELLPLPQDLPRLEQK
jgi:hypothetical protein